MTLRRSPWIAVLALAGVLAAGSSARVGPVKRQFTDPAGDSGVAADIYATTVSYRAGVITFAVSVRDRSDLLADDWFAVGLDTDDDLLTGAGGLEYAMIFRGSGELQFFHWDGEDVSPAPAPASLKAIFKADEAQIAVARADVGSPVRFNFIVATGAGLADDIDYAPDEGFWGYSVAGQLRSLSARFTRTRRLLALDPNSVRIRTSTGVTVSPDSINCRASVEKRRLRPVRACSWIVARWAVSRRVKVSIAVQFGEQRRTYFRTVPTR